MIICENTDILPYLNTYCQKALPRGIKVLFVDVKNEIIKFEVPVKRLDLEEQLDGDNLWMATIKLEYSIDEFWPVLHRFPENLLDDEDYNFLCETIMDNLPGEVIFKMEKWLAEA